MDTKKCTNCHETKIITQDFPKNGRIYRAVCKICHSKKQMQRYFENHNEHLLKRKENYEKNKDIILEKNAEYRKEKRDAICEQKKEYYQQNRNVILEKSKTKNYKEKRNKYLKEKRKTDKRFSMVCAYRARLNEVLHKQKKNTYISYLNCKREMFLDWIEYLFDNEFCWEDYGKKWVIDHVIPIDFFDLEKEEHIYKCFSWFNLRPCEKEENSSKSNKILEDIIKTHQDKLNNFLKIKRYQADIEIYQWLREELRYGKKPSVLDDSHPSS